MNLPFAPMSTIACTPSSALAASTASRSSTRTVMLIALTGGLSMVMTATAAGRLPSIRVLTVLPLLTVLMGVVSDFCVNPLCLNHST